MKKIKTLEQIPALMDYMEKYNLILKIYADYYSVGSWQDPMRTIYFDHGWHYYFTIKQEKITPICNMTRDELMRCIDGNLLQINERYFNRNYYMLGANYYNHT